MRKKEAVAEQAISEQADTFIMTRSELRAMFGFYKGLYAADAIYQTCQNTQFRQYAKGCLAAQNAHNAFAHVGELIGESL